MKIIRCIYHEYVIDLPKKSIIICISQSRKLITLLRGLTRIVEELPIRYIKKINLIDDAITIKPICILILKTKYTLIINAHLFFLYPTVRLITNLDRT